MRERGERKGEKENENERKKARESFSYQNEDEAWHAKKTSINQE